MRRAIARSALALPLVIVAAVLPAGVSASAPASGAEAGAPRPNIVLILTDDQTMDALDPGAPVVMPHLESELADPAQGWIDFRSFFFNNPLCCPSRATILTGRYSHHTGVESNSNGALLDESDTIATWLDAAGYRTGMIGKYINDYPFRRGDYKPPGWDYWAAQVGKGNLGYYDYTLFESRDGSSGGTRLTYKFGQDDYSTLALTELGTRFIDETPGGTPFFLQLSLAAAHGDWKPETRYANAFAGADPSHDPSFNEADVTDKPAWVQALPRLSAEEVAASDESKLRHYRTIRSVDDSVADIESALQAAGQLDNTVIIFMTDNGFQFAEHRWVGKRCEYDVCLRSPFLVRYPGASGHVDGHLVSNVDVAPTIADLAGATPATPVDGVSLAPMLRGTAPPPWRDGVLIHNAADGSDTVPTWWGVRTADYAYVELDAPPDPDAPNVELYDLTGRLGPPDPYELRNRAFDPAYASVRADLAERLAELQGVDLVTTVTDSPDPVGQDAKETYLVTVTNAGLGTAYDTALSNPLPAGAVLVSATPSAGACDTSVGCQLGDIAGGKKATVAIVVRAGSPGTMTNTATASGPAPDPTPANASASASTTVIGDTSVADLSVTLKDAPDPVPMGGRLVYTATVANAGPDTANDVVLTDPLPGDTTFVSAKPGARCPIPPARTVTCALGRIAPGSTAKVTITVVADRIGPVSNTVTVTGAGTDPDAADRTASSSTSVTDPDADVSIAISDAPDPIALGAGDITYSIVATNHGPATATGIRIVDELPDGVTLVSAKPGTKCAVNGVTVSCNGGSLTPGSSTRITIVVRPTVSGTVVDTVGVSATTPDPAPGNDRATTSTTVQPARVGRPTHVRWGWRHAPADRRP